MDTAILLSLLLVCAPQVAPATARALVDVESAGNPYAIGVVGAQLQRQPRDRAEALATARALAAADLDFSVGLAQINVRNFGRLGLTLQTAFDPCTNLGAMQTVLVECFDRAHAAPATRSVDARQHSLRRALSCYYSGNFATGFRHGYVDRVVRAASRSAPERMAANPKEST